MSTVIPVILCGGVGSRLWPASRSAFPKQFLPLVGENSMLQETILRLEGIEGLGAPILLTNEKLRFTAAEQMMLIGHDATVILEPEGRSTAPAIALAAFYAQQTYDDATLVVLASDHVILDADVFREQLQKAVKAAASGNLITFGIVPDGPETGYGYIKVKGSQADQPFVVDQFVEKPAREVAEQYLAEGGYFWNSGMFVMQPDSYLAELQKFEPEIHSACQQAMSQATIDHDFIRPEETAFLSCRTVSIDYAVMEKTDRVKLLPLEAGWSDVGSWSEVLKVSEKDDQGNATRGDIWIQDCKNSFISSNRRFVAAMGVENLLVIDSADALLVADLSKAQQVKQVVEYLTEMDRSEAVVHQKAYRPWGNYECIDVSERFKVKHITVKPGAKLSLQKHFHRAEHWVVVKGTAITRRGNEEITLVENESIYLPIGETHSLYNPGKIPLEVIEVQTGSYLGEDDIIRFDDIYGR